MKSIKRNSQKPKKAATAEDLILQANIALSKIQPELASQFYQRALLLSPNDTNIMDALADVYLQLGEHEQAFDLLKQSTEKEPRSNPFKWCFFAQLQSGFNALQSYNQGIEILTETLPQMADEVTAYSSNHAVI
jgi:tetratricopeptide (TPR) repeat protein